MMQLITQLQASWWHALAQLWKMTSARRDARGNNSIEMAIIVGVVLVVGIAVAGAIAAAFNARIGGIK